MSGILVHLQVSSSCACPIPQQVLCQHDGILRTIYLLGITESRVQTESMIALQRSFCARENMIASYIGAEASLEVSVSLAHKQSLQRSFRQSESMIASYVGFDASLEVSVSLAHKQSLQRSFRARESMIASYIGVEVSSEVSVPLAQKQSLGVVISPAFADRL